MVYTVLVTAILFILMYFYLQKNEVPAKDPLAQNKNGIVLSAIILLSFALRVFPALFFPGYAGDMACWKGWSAQAFGAGLWNFYSADMFCDYPPGYIYVLYILGGLAKILPRGAEELLFKLPAILTDVAFCVILYTEARKASEDTRLPLCLAFVYAICPASIVNSAVWGQVDSIFTFFLVLSLLRLSQKQYAKSGAYYALAVLLKPQALLFAPIFLLTVIENRKISDFGKKLLGAAGSFIGVFCLFVLPFAVKQGAGFIFSLYGQTLASYPYATLNAFNLYTILGANGAPLSETVYPILGTLGILFSVFLSCFVFYKGKDTSRFFYAAALVITGVFLFGTKMHERYLFPAIPLLLFAYAYKKDKRILLSAFFVSLLHFINVGYVYANSLRGVLYYPQQDALPVIFSFLHLLAFLYMVYAGLDLYTGFASFLSEKDNKSGALTKKDGVIVFVVTALYALLAFSNLGYTDAPKTKANRENIADFGSMQTIKSVSVYKGIGDCSISFEFSHDGETWSAPLTLPGKDCFKWESYPLETEGRFVRVSFGEDFENVYEAAFWDRNGNLLPLASESSLFDEQHLAQISPTFLNGTYFDEIYHARTAFEHIENTPFHYENTHPPLGKLLIGVGIRLFGMNPFGWRFMGTLFGVLLLPLLYVFGKKLFKRTSIASVSMLLFAVDLMHFAQTRIATIDTYPVFFILLMYFFMYLFFEKAETLSIKKVLLYLAASGVSFGLAIASKWIGFYAGAGLAVLFFVAFYKRFKAHGARTLWLLGYCVLFFVLVPFLIYYASYIPIHIADQAESFWASFWKYQNHMFSYHSRLTADHPFGSKWYDWPFVVRPIWYFGDKVLAKNADLTSSIVGMGNPPVWWFGCIAAVITVVLSVINIKKKSADTRPLFISIGFLSQLVPWMFVDRVVFIYHYFASLPFSILALSYLFSYLQEKFPFGKKIMWGFLGAFALLFFLFFPIVSGLYVPRSFVLTVLRWFGTWTFTY